MKPQESFINQPIRALQTMLRVLAEDDPQYPSLVPDGIYGNETRNAVAAFQRRHGLSATGITDQDTWDLIVSEYEPALIRIDEAEALHIILNPNQVIRRGERHPYVYLIQAMLTGLDEIYGSFGAPSISGILDDATSDAISAFQQLNRLPMTGHMDKQTWKHLALQYPLAVNIGNAV